MWQESIQRQLHIFSAVNYKLVDENKVGCQNKNLTLGQVPMIDPLRQNNADSLKKKKKKNSTNTNNI